MVRRQDANLLTVKHVTKTYHSDLRALEDICFSIKLGECVGLIGESGSGKSTLVRCLLQVEQIDCGEVLFQSHSLHNLKGKRLRTARRNMQAVFQHPDASLNPRMKVIDSLMEPYDIEESITFSRSGKMKRRKRAIELLEMVNLPTKVLDSYPHELSGGMKQRVNIARAISTNPALLLLDEPTASLDVSVQASILNLLKDLQEECGFSYLFISHDLSAVNFMSDSVMVMKEGEIVDAFEASNLFGPDRDAYTKELLEVYEM
ncbi:ABC transporter ATP-binding protein [Guptibacillus algicola]|uniref:ABC transporter ATP-binding protein n=1 Tax=Guptibacillus algicola TaxID=225844 RepID=UPI001CD496E4|nr:dipeptide/oligopeptide/nickel ABC transporter ATP-binding protein [Alkalihalobacillus algicola]MCA0987366.1 dipeptide/oligopeptide/nickel ABC transporter ATP-binding protein [Alkalihalobacillus algicola]